AETAVDRDRLQPAIQVMLAEITAVRRVGYVVRIGHFGGRDNFMPQTEFSDKIQRNSPLMRWVTRALGSNCKCVVSKDLSCHHCEVRTIDATAERNDA